MECTENANVIITLCCDMQLKKGMLPLSAGEWGVLAKRLYRAGLQPKDLLHMRAEDVKTALDFDGERVCLLLERADTLPFEYERLARKNIYIITRADKGYPPRLKEKLLSAAPPFFYYAGDLSLAGTRGIAITGARKVDASATDFALEAAVKVAKEGYTLYAGGAEGIDNITEAAALKLNGRVVSYLAGSMEYKLARPEIADKVFGGSLLLMTAIRPDLLFLAEFASPRNKCIYASAEAAFMACCDDHKGIAWDGAAECIRNGWAPVFVHPTDSPRGNAALLREGGFDPGDLAARTIAEMIADAEASEQKEQTSLFGLFDS